MKTNGKMKVRRKKRVKWKRSKPLSFLILLIVFYMFGSVTIHLGHVVSLELISIQKLKG